MKRRVFAGLFVVLAGAATLLAPVVAQAQAPDPRQPVILTLAGPDDVPVGNQARLILEFRDQGGQPIAGARIAITSPATFAGTVGEMALGAVTTDAQGSASFDYRLRIQGRNQFIARYHGDENRQPVEARAVVDASGTAQLAQRTAGIAFPVPINWALIAVLVAVWSVYFVAMLLVAGIPEDARQGSDG